MTSSLLAGTYGRMLQEQLPNLFRLYVNPFVAQTCLCLSKYVSGTWGTESNGHGEHQSFLANSFGEALSGAIKLARYAANVEGRPTLGLVLDPTGKLGPFASAPVSDQRIEFIPGLVSIVADSDQQTVAGGGKFGFIVLVAAENGALDRHAAAVRVVAPRCATGHHLH